MPHKKLKLADILAPESLQKLQDSISTAANISTVILDSSGSPVTEISNSRGICRMTGDAHRPDGGVCRRTRKKLCGMAHRTRTTASMICPLSGMIGASVPIFLDDTFLGAWIIGQLRFHGDSLEAFEEAARKAGIDSVTAQKLLEDIPVLSRSRFDTIVEFMSIMTGEIVKLAANNLEMTRKNEQFSEFANNFKHSMNAMRALADTPNMCIYLTDFYTGEVIMHNNAYADYLGKPFEELVGTRCYENLGYTSRCPFCPSGKLIDESGNPSGSYVWEHYFEQFNAYLQISSRSVRWVDGRLVNMSVSTNITQQKKIEDELFELAFFDQTLLWKRWLHDEISVLNKMQENILNDINVAIYVSDLETNRILFVNESMRKKHAGKSLKDRICWEALQNKTKRCSFCPVPYLLKNPGKSYRWELFDGVPGRLFQIQDSIIPWMGGKLAHLEYAVDIPGTKEHNPHFK